MLTNKTFYPTPRPLIRRMVSKIKGEVVTILEPSAGKGDIIEYFSDSYEDRLRYAKISAIEIDADLRATLIGKRIKVIDSDFLLYSGPDKFDLIIANPPFDEGDKHLLKAIDIMYRGQIVFLLNAETIRNPHTNTRKLLAQKLKELNAEIEFIERAFMLPGTERKTPVEVALIYINIERNVEDDLFADVTDKARDPKPELEKNYEVSTGKTIFEMVAEYNQILNIGVETIAAYYRNYKKIGGYIGLNKEAGKDYSGSDMTDKMQHEVNNLIQAVRTNFWRRTLDLKEVRNRMTSKKQNEFEEKLKTQCDMDFTENNIRQFVLNLIGSYEQILTEAVMDIFDKFTVRHSYSKGLYEENVHYFNGWKTNNAFKVGKKVIIPIYGSYCGDHGPFIGYSGKWELHYSAMGELSDIDTVMNYFDGMSHYNPITHAIKRAFERGQSRKIYSTYFEITCYKKGTIHLTFRDEGILRRFNVTACRGKNWLPHDYGTKPFSDMNIEEKTVVNSFEGQMSYVENLGKPLFAASSNRLMLNRI
uniref:DUF4942 domain-containing protein n=2 Tax=viral metagenome TaxID=1070528 RepID=A0A6M3IZH3_9ZZZZ